MNKYFTRWYLQPVRYESQPQVFLRGIWKDVSDILTWKFYFQSPIQGKSSDECTTFAKATNWKKPKDPFFPNIF